MIELGQIVSGLVQRTAEGKLKWTRSVQDGRFIASVDAISITIGEEEGSFSSLYRLDILDETGATVESLRYHEMTAEQYEELARLYVLDETGATVESFRYYEMTDEQYEELARLYVLARRSALDIESVLEKLAKVSSCS